MSIVLRGFVFSALAFLFSCTPSPERTDIPMPWESARDTSSVKLDQTELGDRVLGAIVGSAIGDAMGASTEMWYRKDIQAQYGYITELTTALREKSAEGTWRHNMVAGSTTDDTRWKVLMGDYINQHRGELSTDHFAAFITDYYEDRVTALADAQTKKSTDVLDERIEQLNWIKEWARVTMAYQQGTTAFLAAQHRFYGGEMSCAGMLYSPVFGLVAASPEEAYLAGIEHALFDLGYARDITGLVAAITNKALQTSNVDSLLAIHQYIDPYGYQDARLIGRLSVQMLQEAQVMVQQARTLEVSEAAPLVIPEGFPGTAADWLQEQYLFEELEKRQKAIPFHAGEIWQILVTGLLYGAGDFEKTMTFIVNYGRDNDTVAAVAGMILGAALGYDQLPDDWKTQTIEVSKEVMGLDLEMLAKKILVDIR
ncbi:MAG TPA: ADP-ribosylglycohydrolase family protein [Saprospiraceae bacterium]|nr:ADP-ribosylglycohydrolase family protein [Saprospiraceae bacterium]